MTKLRHSVDPPLARRPVQLTLIFISGVLLVWQSVKVGRILHRNQSHSERKARLAEAAGRGDQNPLIQIDLNRAGQRELSLLPRIGPVLARRICRNREREGPFRSVGDLARIHGIGNATLREVAPYLWIERAADSPPSTLRSEQASEMLNGPIRGQGDGGFDLP